MGWMVHRLIVMMGRRGSTVVSPMLLTLGVWSVHMVMAIGRWVGIVWSLVMPLISSVIVPSVGPLIYVGAYIDR